MVEEPVEALKRDVAVDLFEDVERAPDRLVIGRVEPPRPLPFREQADDGFEVAFHIGRHVGPLDTEILEVGG